MSESDKFMQAKGELGENAIIAKFFQDVKEKGLTNEQAKVYLAENFELIVHDTKLFTGRALFAIR